MLILGNNTGYTGKVTVGREEGGTDSGDSSQQSEGLTKGQVVGYTIEHAGQAVGNILNFIGNYKAAKKNYAITQQNAAELIDQTNKQVALMQKQWNIQDAENQLFIANSGLDSSSFADVERYSLQEMEQEGIDMRQYARKKATEMIRQARAAKNEAKKKKNAGLAGTIVGGAAGGIIGGPLGAAVGSNLGGQIGYGIGSL
mgnify:CR=1 FL=1